MFNISCFFMTSWALRLLYPCIFEIGLVAETDNNLMVNVLLNVKSIVHKVFWSNDN